MHDCKNEELAIGDIVLVPMKVKELTGKEEHCNITLETLGPIPDTNGQHCVIANINSKQTQKVPMDEHKEIHDDLGLDYIETIKTTEGD